MSKKYQDVDSRTAADPLVRVFDRARSRMFVSATARRRRPASSLPPRARMLLLGAILAKLGCSEGGDDPVRSRQHR
jgi:hypothetical protein